MALVVLCRDTKPLTYAAGSLGKPSFWETFGDGAAAASAMNKRVLELKLMSVKNIEASRKTTAKNAEAKLKKLKKQLESQVVQPTSMVAVPSNPAIENLQFMVNDLCKRCANLENEVKGLKTKPKKKCEAVVSGSVTV
jgi:hypothetical protein